MLLLYLIISYYCIFIEYVDSLFCSEIDHDLSGDTQLGLTNDKEEGKLDYWREDTMLHAFHAMFHRLFDGIKNVGQYPYIGAMFWYAHEQFLRR